MVLFSELAGAPADCIWPGSQGAKNVDRKDGDSGWITVINGLWMDYGFMDCGWISPKSENEFWRMLVQSIRSHALGIFGSWAPLPWRFMAEASLWHVSLLWIGPWTQVIKPAVSWTFGDYLLQIMQNLWICAGHLFPQLKPLETSLRKHGFEMFGSWSRCLALEAVLDCTLDWEQNNGELLQL
jgi:hypothetical protein